MKRRTWCKGRLCSDIGHAYTEKLKVDWKESERLSTPPFLTSLLIDNIRTSLSREHALLCSSELRHFNDYYCWLWVASWSWFFLGVNCAEILKVYLTLFACLKVFWESLESLFLLWELSVVVKRKFVGSSCISTIAAARRWAWCQQSL